MSSNLGGEKLILLFAKNWYGMNMKRGREMGQLGRLNANTKGLK